MTNGGLPNGGPKLYNLKCTSVEQIKLFSGRNKCLVAKIDNIGFN